MGASFVNYQVRGSDTAAVVAAARLVVQARGYVSPPKNGWITLYDEVSEGQDAHELGRIGADLSAALDTAILGLLVDNSSMFVYYLFENGDLSDEYNSVPVPTNPNAEQDSHQRFAGRPDILLKFCPPGTHRQIIEKALLRPDSLVEGGFASMVSAEERLHPVLACLGIDQGRGSAGFHDFERHRQSFADADQFIAIGGKPVRRPSHRIVPPQIPPR